MLEGEGGRGGGEKRVDLYVFGHAGESCRRESYFSSSSASSFWCHIAVMPVPSNRVIVQGTVYVWIR